MDYAKAIEQLKNQTSPNGALASIEAISMAVSALERYSNTDDEKAMIDLIDRREVINLLHYYADEAASAVVADVEALPTIDSIR